MSKKPVLNNTQNLLLRAISEVALFVLCIVPGLIFSFKSLQEPWNLFRLARAYFFLYNPARATFNTAGSGYRGEHVGVEMIQTTLITVTGWPLEAIALIPIGSLLLAVLCYGLARRISHSPWTAGALTLYLSWYYPSLYSQFSTQTYVWTHVLFFSFLILLLFWIRQRTFALSLLMIVIFIATFFQYHTTPMWIMAALIIAVTAIKLNERWQKISSTTVSWALPLFCVVFYFTFDTVAYGNGLARLKSESVNESLFQSLFYKIVIPLLSWAPHRAQGVFETATVSPIVATRGTLLILLLLVILVGIWCMVKIYNTLKSGDVRVLIQTDEDIFIWVVIGVTITHTVLYALYGAISLRVIPLAIPLILPLMLRRFKWGSQLELILSSTLALLAIVGFASFSSALLPDPLASQTGLASKLLKENDRLLGDANVYGGFLLNATQDNKIVDFVWLDAAKYAAVTGQGPLKPDEFEYLAVDLSNKPITSANWRFLEPWTHYLAAINGNHNLNKVYDSEHLQLFQPHVAQLPDPQFNLHELNIGNRSFLIDAFRLFLAIIILAFIPGAVIIVMVNRHLPILMNDTATVIGLAVGLSIAFATIISYIADFTPFGLAWFVPLCALVTLDVLGIYLFIYYYKYRLRPAWVTALASLLITLLIWSFLSTGAAHARTQQYAEFTEFFVTRADLSSGSLNLNIVNRLSQPANFTLTFTLDGLEVQTIGPQFMAPNSAWVEKWHPPSDSINDRLVITLEKDGSSYRELHLPKINLDSELAEK